MNAQTSEGSARTPIDCRGMVESVRSMMGHFFGTLILTGECRGDEDSFTAQIVHRGRRFISIAPTIFEAGMALRYLYEKVLQSLLTETLNSLEGDGPCADQVF